MQLLQNVDSAQCEYWYWQLLSDHIYTGAVIAVMHQPQSSTTLLSLSDQMHSLRALVPRLQEHSQYIYMYSSLHATYKLTAVRVSPWTQRSEGNKVVLVCQGAY